MFKPRNCTLALKTCLKAQGRVLFTAVNLIPGAIHMTYLFNSITDPLTLLKMTLFSFPSLYI